MPFEYIVINNIQGKGVGKLFMFWDILPRRLYSLLILSRECDLAWWWGQWSVDRVLGMCILWRETASLIWESQMEAPLWRVGRQPWQFCSEQHPAVSFLTLPSCPLVSCQGRFSFYLGYSAVKYPWADCVMSLYIWPQYQLFGKVLIHNSICIVQLKSIFLSGRFHEFLQMHGVSRASLSPMKTSLGAPCSQPCPSHFNPGYREPEHVPLPLCFPECSHDGIIQGPAFWFWLHMCN